MIEKYRSLKGEQMDNTKASAAEILGKNKIPTILSIHQRFVNTDYFEYIKNAEQRIRLKNEDIEKCGGIEKYIKVKRGER